MTITAPNIQVIGARVLVIQDQAQEKTAGGLILPEQNVKKSQPLSGTVVSVGEGFWTTEGQLVPLKTQVGDKILWANLGGVPINVNGTELLVINESHILAIVGKEEVLDAVNV